MSQSYVKECISCQKKIRMSDELGKWKPFNIENNTEHDCKKQDNESKKNLVTLDQVIKKLQSIAIFINLEELMKQ
jgi:hypothetical protein